jgi:hypothetical protein
LPAKIAVGAQLAQKLEAIHAGQVELEEHEIRLRGPTGVVQAVERCGTKLRLEVQPTVSASVMVDDVLACRRVPGIESILLAKTDGRENRLHVVSCLQADQQCLDSRLGPHTVPYYPVISLNRHRARVRKASKSGDW